jgi:tetratricopeptide (TPR) repeat protein
VASSFPHDHLFGSYMGTDMILVASEQPISLAPGAAALFPANPEIARDLARVGVHNLADLALLYTSSVRAPASGTLLNNDDNSLIQYRAPLELLQGLEPQHAFIRVSKEDLLQLLYPGADEKTVLLALGSAAYGRQALPTLEYLLDRLQEMGDVEVSGQLRGLSDALRNQLKRSAIVQQSLIAAEARIASRDTEGAVAALAEAQTAGLVGSEEWVRAGMILLNAAHNVEAEQALDQAVSLADPRFQYQSLAARGASRYRLGRLDEGKADIDAAKQLDPSGALAYLLHAIALHDIGNGEAAIQELQEGMKVAPEDKRLSSFLHDFLKKSPAAKPAAPSPPATP